MYKDIFCPKTPEKYCVGGKCAAFKSGIKPSLLKCVVCEETFNRGASCTQVGHKRHPIEVITYNRCLEYNIEINDLEVTKSNQ